MLMGIIFYYQIQLYFFAYYKNKDQPRSYMISAILSNSFFVCFLFHRLIVLIFLIKTRRKQKYNFSEIFATCMLSVSVFFSWFFVEKF